MSSVEVARFQNRVGLSLAADIAGPEDGKRIVLLHGGGQTRHSWRKALLTFANAGYRTIALDARGHGDSDWDPNREYSIPDLALDLCGVLEQIGGLPILIGGSMGGVSALYAVGESDRPIARGLVLVDITPRVDAEGSQRVVDFMLGHPEGFATVEEAADAVAAYNPHRPRPKDTSGLKRNLRERNGRWYWHFDPEVARNRKFHEIFDGPLDDSASRVTIPTMLVRGMESDLVREAEVAHFRAIMPHAEYVDVKGAGHMVAGDKNDVFNAAVMDFVQRIDAER